MRCSREATAPGTSWTAGATATAAARASSSRPMSISWSRAATMSGQSRRTTSSPGLAPAAEVARVPVPHPDAEGVLVEPLPREASHQLGDQEPGLSGCRRDPKPSRWASTRTRSTSAGSVDLDPGALDQDLDDGRHRVEEERALEHRGAERSVSWAAFGEEVEGPPEGGVAAPDRSPRPRAITARGTTARARRCDLDTPWGARRPGGRPGPRRSAADRQRGPRRRPVRSRTSSEQHQAGMLGGCVVAGHGHGPRAGRPALRAPLWGGRGRAQGATVCG